MCCCYEAKIILGKVLCPGLIRGTARCRIPSTLCYFTWLRVPGQDPAWFGLPLPPPEGNGHCSSEFYISCQRLPPTSLYPHSTLTLTSRPYIRFFFFFIYILSKISSLDFASRSHTKVSSHGDGLGRCGQRMIGWLQCVVLLGRLASRIFTLIE